MSNFTDLSDAEIKKNYEKIKEFYASYLAKLGVKLPALTDKNEKFTKNALVLVYLALNYPKTRQVSKIELTHFIRKFYPNVPDVQQARHLAAQDGWWIVSGGRDNIVRKVKRGYYQLHTLEQPYLGFKNAHRITEDMDWESIKKAYGYRCATCGSREDEPHFHWPATKTKLQKAHMDPNKQLKPGNIIPQCQKCNRADRNRWVYDNKGRVIKLADPKFVLNFDVNVQKRIYEILKKKFEK